MNTSKLQTKTAITLLESLGGRSVYGAPVRRSFVISPTKGKPSQLVSLLSSAKKGGGGRGGRVRIMLEISLLLSASIKSPYSTTRSPTSWAELLGLEDSQVAGARSVRNALKQLEQHKLIRIEPKKDLTIYLLKETGDGSPYTPPYQEKKGYFRIPPELWTTGLINRLEGPGLCMYLCALATVRREVDGKSNVFWFAPAATRKKFGVGNSTRLKGIKELIEQGVFADVTDTESEEYLMGYKRNGTRYLRITAAYMFPEPGNPPGAQKDSSAGSEINPWVEGNEWPF